MAKRPYMTLTTAKRTVHLNHHEDMTEDHALDMVANIADVLSMQPAVPTDVVVTATIKLYEPEEQREDHEGEQQRR